MKKMSYEQAFTMLQGFRKIQKYEKPSPRIEFVAKMCKNYDVMIDIIADEECVAYIIVGDRVAMKLKENFRIIYK